VTRGWLVGEIQTNLRGDGLRFAAGFEVHVEDEIVAGIEAPGHAGGFLDDRRVWFPEEKMAVGVEGIASVEFQLHAWNSLLPVMMLASIRCGSIDEDIGVMNDLWSSGQDFHSANE